MGRDKASSNEGEVAGKGEAEMAAPGGRCDPGWKMGSQLLAGLTTPAAAVKFVTISAHLSSPTPLPLLGLSDDCRCLSLPAVAGCSPFLMASQQPDAQHFCVPLRVPLLLLLLSPGQVSSGGKEKKVRAKERKEATKLDVNFKVRGW